MRSPTAASLMTIIFSSLFRTCLSANWAQTSGTKATDNIVPPSYFGKRYGHALVVIDSGEEGINYAQEAEKDPKKKRLLTDRMFVLGGDDFDVRGGGGGYKNDIWVTSGADWTVVEDLTIIEHTSDQKTRLDAWESSPYKGTLLKPGIIPQYKTKSLSRMVWTRVKDDLTPGVTGDYYEMIACPISDFQRDRGGGGPFFHACNYQKDSLQGAVWWSKRWSPRRNHAAVAFRPQGEQLTRMWVLGGRARLYEDYPDGWNRVHGGYNEVNSCDCDNWFLPSGRYNDDGKIVIERTDIHPIDDKGFPITEFCVSIQKFGEKYRNCFLRDSSEDVGVLMNDVWVSPPEDNTALAFGEEWALINPGCMVRYYPYALPHSKENRKNGTRWAKCGSDKDCKGDSFCDLSIGACVCKMWTPREDHAVAVFKSKIYVTGGYVWLEKHDCGQNTCGGEYRSVVNDVWWSSDGRTWATRDNHGTLNAEWKPRAGHLLLVPQFTTDTGAARHMFIVGGQSTSMEDSTTDGYFNDVWQSREGKVWNRVDVECDWAPRTGLFGAFLDDVLVIGGGHDAENMYDDVWTWNRDSDVNTRFVRDFSNNSVPFRDYVRADSPVTVIPFIKRENQERLLKLIPPVTDLAGLAEVTSAQILELQDIKRLNYPDICLHVEWAKTIIDKCTPKIETKDEVEWDGVFVKLGEEKVNITSSDLKQIEYVDYCTERNSEWTGLWSEYILLEPAEPDPFPYTCRWQFEPKSHAESIVYQDRLYIVGGIHDLNGNKTSADVWYRDDKLPVASFKTKPTAGTWEGLFEFKCDDEPFTDWSWTGCRYEYRVFHGDGENNEPLEVFRDWFANDGVLDFGSSWWWPMQGPNGNLPHSGTYILQVRAVDPAGNKDIEFVEGRNQHTWDHLSEPPWPIIFTIVFLVLVGSITGISYWRYVERKKALQRYAMKRMRRKFKRMQKIKAGQLHKKRKERAEEALKDTIIRDEEKRQEVMDKEVEDARAKRRKRRGGRS